MPFCTAGRKAWQGIPEQISEFFKSLGNKVFRNGLGDVELGEYGVGGIMNHKPINRAKLVSLAAVPNVIQNGRQIGYDPNWKGRGYPSYIFAAPVMVGDTEVFVAAVVDQRPDNKFYLSEMVDSEGNYVRIEESPSSNSKNGVTEGAGQASGVGVTAGPEGLSMEGNPLGEAPNPLPPVNPNIPQPADSVNSAEPDYALPGPEVPEGTGEEAHPADAIPDEDAAGPRLLREDRGVFDTIRDWLSDAVHWLKGNREQKRMILAQRLFEKALRTSDPKMGMSAAQSLIARTQSMRWADQINGALYTGKNIRRNDTLIVGYPADTVVGNEINNKPLAIPQSILTKASSGKDISHSVKRGKLARLDEGIKQAPITIINPDRNAVVYVTSIKQGGLPVVAAFDLDANFDGDDVHKATSIHLQVDTWSMLEALPESATVYIRKNELDPVGATNNLRGLAAKIEFIDGTISERIEPVKRENSPQDPAYYESMADAPADDWRPGP